jgi:hypothetical protein
MASLPPQAVSVLKRLMLQQRHPHRFHHDISSHSGQSQSVDADLSQLASRALLGSPLSSHIVPAALWLIHRLRNGAVEFDEKLLRQDANDFDPNSDASSDDAEDEEDYFDGEHRSQTWLPISSYQTEVCTIRSQIFFIRCALVSGLMNFKYHQINISFRVTMALFITRFK